MIFRQRFFRKALNIKYHLLISSRIIDVDFSEAFSYPLRIKAYHHVAVLSFFYIHLSIAACLTLLQTKPALLVVKKTDFKLPVLGTLVDYRYVLIDWLASSGRHNDFFLKGRMDDAEIKPETANVLNFSVHISY